MYVRTKLPLMTPVVILSLHIASPTNQDEHAALEAANVYGLLESGPLVSRA